MEPAATSLQNQLYEVHEKYYGIYKNSVYNRTRRRLSRYRNTSVNEEAEDLLQEIFHGVFRWMINYYKQHAALPSEEVFVRVMKTIEINEYRRYVKRLKYPMVEAVYPNNSSSAYTDPESVVAFVESRSPTPEEEFLWREYESRLAHCLKKLKSKESSALLCKARGDSDKEVAILMAEDEKKVTHSIIPLARKKLRKCMEGYVHGNGK